MRRLFVSAFKPLAMTLALVLVVLTLQSMLFAQQTGQITGTVLDATGAAIPNAKVVLTDEATKATRQTTSNGVGFFSFSAVMPANYDLKVEAKGFKNWSVTGIHMSPGDKRDITKVELAVGAAAESVSVEATVTGVDVVSSPEKSATITANDIKRQSTVGRNALELLRLLPGMSVQSWMDNKPAYDPTQQAIWNSPLNNYGINGMAPGSGGSSISTDGAQILDVGNMGATLATVNMDMVEEVKVQTSNFSADTNRGPVVINAVGKSGSNNYHGAAYFYARNTVLNSNDWFNNNQGIKSPDNTYYYPGGNFGGPVKIPGTNLDKKMFFFVGVEAYRQNLPQSPILAQVPTDGERIGDFSWASMAPLCAPQMPTTFTKPDGSVVPWAPFLENPNVANVTKGPGQCVTPTLWWNMQSGGNVTPIVNGQLQSFMMNPAGQAYMNWLPKANATPTATNSYSNFVQVYSNAMNSFQLHPRVDYNFNDNNKLHVAYNLQKEMDPTAQAQWWAPQNAMLYPGKVQAQMTSNVVSVNYMRVFSPTLTSETVVAASLYNGPIVLTDPKDVSRSGMNFPMVFNNGVDQLPQISGSGIPSLQMQSGFINNQWLNKKSTYTLQENVTKVFLTHTLKLGGNYERAANSGGTQGATAGQVSFGSNDWQFIWAGPAGNYSGWQGCSASSATPACFNGVAMLLFGWPNHFSQDEKALQTAVAYSTVGFYATDNWKVSKRLTLDLGLRYDHMTPWTDMHGVGAAVFDPTLYAQQVTVDSALHTASTVQYPGMKWHADDPSIPVAGTTAEWGFLSPRLGMSWDIFGTGKWVLRGGWGSYYWQGGLGQAMAALTPGLGQHSFRQDAPGGGWNFDMIAAMAGSSQLFGDQGATFITPNQKQPVTNNWNFTISHPTVWNSFLEISYVGNQSKNLLLDNNNSSINLIPLGGMYAKPFPTWALDNKGRASLDGIAWNNAAKDTYRPFTWYTNELRTNRDDGWSNYHSLQVSWNKTKGWATFGLNYTFSKALGIYTDGNPFNLQSEYGPLGFDRTHVANTSYSFDLGNRVRGDFAGSRILKGLANGWQLSGITTWQSGPPYTAINSSNLGFNSWVWLQNTYNYDPAGVVTNYIPNQVLNQVQLNNTNMLGTPDIALQPDIKAGCDPTAHKGASYSVFNTNCFIIPNYMQNGPVWKGYFHSPGYFTSDLTMAKTFRIAEQKTLQFRASAFNFLNHPLHSFNGNDYSGQVTGLSVLAYAPDPGYAPGQLLQPLDFVYNQNGNPNAVGTPPIKRGNRLIMLGLKFEF